MCRLLDDGGGGGDKTPPPPCWCSAETAAVLGDPHNEDTARTTTGYRCPPHGSLLQRRGTAAATAAVEGGRPLLRSRFAADVQSNVQRPTSRNVPSRCVSAGDWCCDNGDVDVEDEDDDDVDYYCVYEDENLSRVDNDVNVRDDNRVRAVVLMDNGSDLITGGGGVGGTADGVKPQMAVAERTYASTEAQTDETACSSAYREQRRRERRERRLQQQRRVHPPPPPPPALSSSSLLPPPPPPLLLQQQQQQHQPGIAVSVDPDRLPDLLLNSHLPPPLYTTVGGGVCDVAMATRAANMQASLLPPTTFQHPHQPPGAPVGSAVNTPGGFRLPFGIIPARRRRSVFHHFLI